MKHLRKGNIAFWRYDQAGRRFLSGRIEEVSGKGYPGPGHAMVEGYGRTMWFKVAFCLPPKQGQQASKVLEDAAQKHCHAVESATAEYVRTVNSILPIGITL